MLTDSARVCVRVRPARAVVLRPLAVGAEAEHEEILEELRAWKVRLDICLGLALNSTRRYRAEAGKRIRFPRAAFYLKSLVDSAFCRPSSHHSCSDDSPCFSLLHLSDTGWRT